MVKRATLLGLMIGALALLVLVFYGDSGGAPTTLAEGPFQHPGGQYKTTISCGNTTVLASLASVRKDEGAIDIVWDKTGAVPICQEGLNGEKVWATDAEWNIMTLFYQCPKTPQDETVDKNTLVFLSNLKLGVEYLLVCPSDPRSTHGPTPAAGEVGGSAGVGGPAGPGLPTVRTDSTIGGIAELPEALAAPLAAGDSSGTSAGVIAGVAAAIAGGAIALGGVGWFARRRWLR